MKEKLCSPKTSLQAKEKGFNIPQPECCVLHNDRLLSELLTDSLADGCGFQCYQPTQTILQKWLREKHFLEVLVTCNGSGWFYEINKAYFTGSLSGGTSVSWSKDSGPNDSGEWETYEDALEEGLKKGLKLI